MGVPKVAVAFRLGSAITNTPCDADHRQLSALELWEALVATGQEEHELQPLAWGKENPFLYTRCK
jgi:hypothetical protein